MIKKRKKLKNIKDVISLAKKLYLLRRHAITDDTKKAINILKNYLNFNVIKIKSGTKCWDWVVPKKWDFISAEILFNGKKIFNGKEHVMAIQPYCDSFKGTLSLNNLKKHIVFNKKKPKTFAYDCRLAYRYPYEKNWLISMPYEKVKKLKDGIYDINIKTRFSDGVMEIPEFTIKGKSKKKIILLSDLCHPGQADDGIIGVCLWIKIIQELSNKNKLNYTYTFYAPTETIGSIVWLWKKKSSIKNFKMGIFLESIGNKSDLMCKLSHKGNHQIDKIVKYIFSKDKTTDFSEGVMNDELVFANSDFDIPMISLQRFPYPEYHTSDDNIEAISEKSLLESYDYIIKIINMIETNYIPCKKIKGPFYLSKHQLYKEIDAKLDYWKNWHLMNSFDKKNSIIDIANLLEIDYWEAYENIESFRKAGLIKKLY